ncbi:sulfotransferase [Hyphomonas polymorpha PS728]|uniref:Sulfotransferase n=1 Tax=Hyphomonas polymorpha PS728 TaxID=1280954 RepID=A0A062V5S9_9PROT|nr:sulfotransferase domain-containing protein [Hyphomonas polymorpha]KCZ97321.1 sulfotransferase [Hyphomonas polymorpha PS728]
MRLFVVAPDQVLPEALAEIRSILAYEGAIGRMSSGPVTLPPHTAGNSPDLSGSAVQQAPLPGDAILVFAGEAAPCIDAASGIFVLDGERFLREISSRRRGGELYPLSLLKYGPVEESHGHYARPVRSPGQILASERFIVNGFPKSGSIWLMALLGDVLGLSTDQQLYQVHCADIEIAYHACGRSGSVALVRDLRDVVVSWYHEATRSDEQNGYEAARYPDISTFYFEYFLGRIEGNPLYHHGDLERWVNYLAARAVPILRYEEMLADPAACLMRLLNFWRIRVDPATLLQSIDRMSISRIGDSLKDANSIVAARLSAGHARVGQSGTWQGELPERVADDIQQRFRGFQNRFGYCRI